MMHLRSQFTYRLVTLYSSHKAFSLREPAKQTTRTGTKGVLGTNRFGMSRSGPPSPGRPVIASFCGRFGSRCFGRGPNPYPV
jgi:hypothetical protein